MYANKELKKKTAKPSKAIDVPPLGHIYNKACCFIKQPIRGWGGGRAERGRASTEQFQKSQGPYEVCAVIIPTSETHKLKCYMNAKVDLKYIQIISNKAKPVCIYNKEQKQVQIKM